MDEEYDNSVLDYIPVLGDIYRIGKLGYRISSLISSNSATDELLSQMMDLISAASSSDSIEDAHSHLCNFADLASQYNGGVKYQNVLFNYLSCKGIYLMAICHWSLFADNLKELKNTMEYFNASLSFAKDALNIETTWFTDNRNLVKEVQSIVSTDLLEITDAIKKYERHVKLLDKKLNPWKYRLRWLIPLIIMLTAVVGYVIVSYDKIIDLYYSL